MTFSSSVRAACLCPMLVVVSALLGGCGGSPNEDGGSAEGESAYSGRRSVISCSAPGEIVHFVDAAGRSSLIVPLTINDTSVTFSMRNGKLQGFGGRHLGYSFSEGTVIASTAPGISDATAAKTGTSWTFRSGDAEIVFTRSGSAATTFAGTANVRLKNPASIPAMPNVENLTFGLQPSALTTFQGPMQCRLGDQAAAFFSATP